MAYKLFPTLRSKTTSVWYKTKHKTNKSRGLEVRRVAETSENSRRTQKRVIIECSNDDVQVLRTVKNGVSTIGQPFLLVCRPENSTMLRFATIENKKGHSSLFARYVCTTTLPIISQAQESAVLDSRATNWVSQCTMTEKPSLHNSMSMNAQITHNGLNLYHAWSRGSMTEKWGTFHHFKYEASIVSRVWIDVLSKHMQCNNMQATMQCNNMNIAS